MSVICGGVWLAASGSPFNVGSELGTYTKVTIQTNISEKDLIETGKNDVTIDFGTNQQRANLYKRTTFDC